MSVAFWFKTSPEVQKQVCSILELQIIPICWKTCGCHPEVPHTLPKPLTAPESYLRSPFTTPLFELGVSKYQILTQDNGDFQTFAVFEGTRPLPETQRNQWEVSEGARQEDQDLEFEEEG